MDGCAKNAGYCEIEETWATFSTRDGDSVYRLAGRRNQKLQTWIKCLHMG